ncbi:hypothetical protein ACJMK2_030631 [Sinanodonta woodiana]|uniref:protein-tyrosine-phosphatase n=1 Tax=Sinanodonta woodiana TaxID=1069815 RepID=A0ABD3WXS0_SINWO
MIPGRAPEDVLKGGWVPDVSMVGDIAFKKPAWQSSNSDADKAVDGILSTCSETNKTGEKWWRVDLNGLYRITGLVIFSNSPDALKGFEVRVGNVSSTFPDFHSTCFNHSGYENVSSVTPVMCTSELVGNHIMITIPGLQTKLELCDVRVYGGRSLAYRRFANQTSDFYSGVAYMAVDGETYKVDGVSETCTHTLNEMSPRWMVDLEQVYYISRIDIINRQDCCPERLAGFSIFFARNGSFVMVYKHPNVTPGKITEVTNMSSDKARFIQIQLLDTSTRILTLCEVFIYGDCPDNLCGWSCESPCFCANLVDKRNKIDGYCPSGCAENWNGSKCNLCSIDRGDVCVNICGKCRQGTLCNATDGTCVDGCQPGWWNLSCRSQCNYCNKNTTCTRLEGNCSECSIGKWGPYCEHNCTDCMVATGCNISNGICLQGCLLGRFDVNCDKPCGHCGGDGSCDRDSERCNNGCLPGWMNNTCNIACPSGWFGANCGKECGHCANNSSCDRFNGTCIDGCSPGYTDSTCEKASNVGQYNIASEDKLPYIGGGVGGAVVFLLIVIGVVLWRRRHLSSANRHQRGRPETRKMPSNDTLSTYETATSFTQDTTTNARLPQGAYENVHGIFASIEKPPKTKEKLELVGEGEHIHFPPSLDNVGYIPSDQPSGMVHYQNFDVYYNLEEKRIRVENLEDYVKKAVYLSTDCEQEYQGLVSGPQNEMNVALKPENRAKSRYKGIFAYDNTRVVLDLLPDEPDSDYINACFIDGYKRDKAYIAAQGPTTVTVNDFWRMIWQYNIRKVVMLTGLFEEQKFGTLLVEMVDEETYVDYTIRSLKVTKIGFSSQTLVTQFHFTAWPDRNVPESPLSLVQFWNKVRNTGVPTTDSPTLVHCSAGIGRTGTYLALDYLYSEGQATGSICVFDCINSMRRQRVGMVQTAGQYVYLHEVLVEALLISGKRVDGTDFPNYYHQMREIDETKQQTRLFIEYESLRKDEQLLDKATSITSKNPVYEKAYEFECGRRPENKEKNRYGNIIPSRRYRPFLSTYALGRNDYINAVTLPTLKNKHGLILTQVPLPDTVVDFWTLAFEYEVDTLVMLNEEDMPGEKIGTYWPKENQIAQFGPFTVTKVSETIMGTHVQRILHVSREGKDSVLNVKQFACSVWKTGSAIPENCNQFLSFLEEVESWQRQSNNQPVIVHCLNGAEKSGLFCVTWCVLERVKADREVAIRSVVREISVRRQQIIPSFHKIFHKFARVVKIDRHINKDHALQLASSNDKDRHKVTQLTSNNDKDRHKDRQLTSSDDKDRHKDRQLISSNDKDRQFTSSDDKDRHKDRQLTSSNDKDRQLTSSNDKEDF